jgi:carbonic anhydrase
VIKTAVVQKRYLRTGHPTVHGWVYDVGNGLLRDLNIPYREILGRIQKIYSLEAT